MEAARAPAAPQKVPLLTLQVGWLGPLKRVENALRTRSRAPFPLKPTQKSATQTSWITGNPPRKIRDPGNPGRGVESPVSGV